MEESVCMMRIDKYLAEMGQGTRSEIKKLIRSGRVMVDGEMVKKPELKIDETTQKVSLEGKQIGYAKKEYYMLYKPAGVISATKDDRDKTVLDLITDKKRNDLFPVGRLDKDTEGLLLITNDGELAHRLLSPKKHVDKVYRAVIDGQVTEEDVDLFAKGLEIDDEDGAWRAMPAKLNILSSGTESEVEITIREGKFHQIKRMFEAVDKKVVYLKRLSMGSLRLDETLALGEYRELTEDEVQALKESKGHTNDEE